MRTACQKLPSGRYRARYYDDSEKKWFGQTFDRESLAKGWLADVRSARDRGVWASPTLGKLTFGEWAEEMLASEVQLSRNTRRSQQNHLKNHLKPFWGEKQLASITTRQVLAWAGTLPDAGKSGLSPATCHGIYTLFSKILSGAVEARLIPVSPLPARRKHLPKIQPTEIRVLDEEQITELAGSIEKRYKALVYLLAYGGFRLGEMCALRMGKIDFDEGTVLVTDTQQDIKGVLYYDEGPKTSNSHRLVQLPWPVVEELATHVLKYVQEPKNPRALVFTSPKNTDLRQSNFRSGPWAKAMREINFTNLHPHELRHTAISMWIGAGASAPLVAEWAGDTVSTVTRTYAHLWPGDDDRLRAALSARMRLARPVAVGDSNVIQLRPRRS